MSTTLWNDVRSNDAEQFFLIGPSSNQVLFSHTYNLQYVHFIKSDVTEEIL